MTKPDHTRALLRLIDEAKRRRKEPVPPKASNPAPPLFMQELQSPPTLKEITAEWESLRQRMHQLACSVLAHVEKSGSVRLVDRVVSALSFDPRALQVWFTIFGPVEFVNGKAKYRPGAKTELQLAMAIPFWTIEE